MAVLARPDLKITTTIADGMGTREYPDIKSEWGKDLYCFFLTGFFYQMMSKPGPVRKRILAKLTGRSVEEADRLLYQKASWESQRNQDRCLIGTKMDYSLFGKTDMYIWHGIKNTVEKKLAKNMEKIKATSYPFTYKVFTDLGYGRSAGEHIPRFADEVQVAYAKTMAKIAKSFKV